MPRRRSTIELYWERAEMAPEGVIAQVLVTDGGGSDYLPSISVQIHERRRGAKS